VRNNLKMAVHEWLKTDSEFEIDKDIDNKLLISLVPDEYFKNCPNECVILRSCGNNWKA